MKRLAKLMALMVVAAMATIAMAIPAMAAELTEGTQGADKTITITTPAGLGAEDSVTYTVYRVFAATSDGIAISYQSLDGSAPTGFVVDDANNVYLGTATDTATEAAGEIQIKVGGATKYIVPSTEEELTADQIAAIAAYTGKEEVGTVTITGPEASKTVTVPDYGYFYITTTTGTVVSIDSTHKAADVEDKNSVPVIEKTITGTPADYTSFDEAGKNAVAQVGTVVPYQVKITVGKGAKNYVFHDKMETGLSYRDDVAVSPEKDGDGEDAVTIVKSTETVGEDTITVAFNDGIKEGTEITITYSATVTSDALQTDPANNTASIDYGENYTIEEDTPPAVYNAKFTVTKTDGTKGLDGAGFVIKNANNKYYTLTENGVVWVDSIDAADEHTSNAEGAVAPFTGLGNGTYTLVEKTVPTGYNKAADSTFTVKDGDVTGNNLVQASTVVNNAGSVLPSTGGIGTTIFYVIGGILIAVAAVFLITRKRVANARKEDEEI